MSTFYLGRLKNKRTGRRTGFNRASRSGTGFTLIEAMLSVAFLSIIGIGVICFFKNSVSAMYKTQSNIGLRDESMSAFENMLSELRQSRSASIVIDRLNETAPPNSMISFVLFSTGERISYYQDGSAMYLNRKNRRRKISNNIASLQFSSSSYKAYSVTAELKNSRDSFQFASAVFVRN